MSESSRMFHDDFQRLVVGFTTFVIGVLIAIQAGRVPGEITPITVFFSGLAVSIAGMYLFEEALHND